MTHYQRLRRGGDPDAPNHSGDELKQVATRVTKGAHDVLEQTATESGSSVYDVAKKVLEDWAGRYQNHLDGISESELGNHNENDAELHDKETT